MLSSEEEFFDMLYLGVFTILSPAFDSRFYKSTKPPTSSIDEMAHAVDHFHSLLHVFTRRFHVIVDGEALSTNYVVDRMLAEFAAAATVFSKAHQANEELWDEITFSTFSKNVQGILRDSHPDVFPYYSRCVDQSHKHFVWTGPHLEIVPRSEGVASLIPLATRGELLDLPSHSIYLVDLDPIANDVMPQPTEARQVAKRRERGDDDNLAGERLKKQKH